jgi:hypothetical protein
MGADRFFFIGEASLQDSVSRILDSRALRTFFEFLKKWCAKRTLRRTDGRTDGAGLNFAWI